MYRSMRLFIIAILIPTIAHAAPIDVPDGDWYTNPVNTFYEKGYFNEELFRPSDNATRAEFIAFIVALKNVSNSDSKQVFTDIPVEHPYFTYFQRAAKQGWLKGASSCVGSLPCYAYPDHSINRAEAAALLVRAFNINVSSSAPSFVDNPKEEWYNTYIIAAASICILQGDGESSYIYPERTMNRAEMVTMLYRLYGKLQYPECNDTKQTDNIPLLQKEVGNFEGPYGIHVTDTEIFVMDSIARVVKRYTHNWEKQGELSTPEMEFPHSLAVTAKGEMLVADHRAGFVFRFAKNGDYLGKFHEDAFSAPVHVHIDAKENIWVTDYKDGVVLQFDKDGNQIPWNSHQFEKPHMTIVHENNVYIVEVEKNRVHKFLPDGTSVQWTGSGFHHPTAIHIANDTLYVTDTDNNRIEALSLEGVPIKSVAVDLNSPFHAFVHNKKMYIVNTGDKEVIVLP